MVWNVDKYNIVLGREFCKRNGFTSFDEKLTEWSLSSLQCEVEAAEREAFDTNVRFSSKHPIQGYQLYRDINGPGVQQVSHDAVLVGFEACQMSGSIISAARLAETIVERNAKLHSKNDQYSRLLSKASEAKGVELDNEFSKRVMGSVDVAAVAALLLDKFKKAPGGVAIGTTQSGAIWRASLFEDVTVEKKSETIDVDGEGLFKRGEEFEICDCGSFADYNGTRARVYQPLSDDPHKYFIRVLGTKRGWWTIHEKNMKKVDSARPPVASEASFKEVGIDESGIPVIEELRNLAHRQFGKSISDELDEAIKKLNSEYEDVWSDDVTEPCLFEPLSIKLIANAAMPTNARFYRNTPKIREEVRRQIAEQLSKGIISEAVTPYVSNVLLVKRPHMPGKWRFVVDYRRLNDATEQEPLQMCDPKAQFETLMGKTIFGAVDMSSFYRQCLLEEGSRMFTGFATEDGTYVYNRVPMGIKNACSYSQRKLQEVLAANPILKQAGVKNYFDDVPFGANTSEEFLDILKALLETCRKWKLKLNREKSVLGVDSITHVGFIIDKDGRRVDEERLRDIRELQAPKSVKKVQSILGILNFIRDFIPNFSALALCLTNKLGKAAKIKSQWVWSDQDDAEFRILIQEVLKVGVLEFIDYSKEIHIQCDSSNIGCGAVLFQYDDKGRRHVVCYASRKYSPTETRYSTFQQEAGAIVWALERFKEYTLGHHVIVETDHKNLSYVKRSTMPQLERWRMRLQEFDFEVHYLQGSLNHVADGLSRKNIDDVGVQLDDVLPEGTLKEADIPKDMPIACLDAVEVTTKSATDELWVSSGEILEQEISEAATKLGEADDFGELSMDDTSDSDDSISCDEDGDVELSEIEETSTQDCVDLEDVEIPNLSPEDEIRAVHNAHVGHAGVYVTLQRLLSRESKWGSRAQMLRDIDAFLKGCVVCQKMRKRDSKHSHKVERFMLEGSPFAELSVDILKLPDADVMGNQYIVVVIDSFSHWTQLFACKNKTALNAARAIVQSVGNFGVPLTIRSDGGKEFVNATVKAVASLLGSMQHVVLPYTPTANSIVERVNRSILEKLRDLIFEKALVKHTAARWSDLLPLVQRIINGSFHSSIGTSPASVLFGGMIEINRCLLSKMPTSVKIDVGTYEGALVHNQRVLIEAAERHHERMCDKVMAKAAKGQKGKLDKVINVGDWVVVKPEELRPVHKLASRFLGPFCVFRVNGEIISVCTRDRKIRQFLKRNCELFDLSQMASVEGLKEVAERDNWEYPVESIVGHALILNGGFGQGDILQLPLSHKRVGKKTSYQFLVKWVGYEEPTWQPYRDVGKLPGFAAYVARFPGLNM